MKPRADLRHLVDEDELRSMDQLMVVRWSNHQLQPAAAAAFAATAAAAAARGLPPSGGLAANADTNTLLIFS
ncbi:uncharacterized protein V6R79_015442 [Siganus canaliculatus]